MPPPRRGAGALSGHRRPSSVRPSDVAYIGSNSKTKRPRKTKLCTGVTKVTRDSHTDFKVKRSKVKVSRGGGILWRPPSRQLVWSKVDHFARRTHRQNHGQTHTSCSKQYLPARCNREPVIKVALLLQRGYAMLCLTVVSFNTSSTIFYY